MGDMVLQKLGNRIKQAREALGITQEELGARIGKTQKAISGYESGARGIRISDLPKLAKELEVSVAYFFGDIAPDTEITALVEQFPPESREQLIRRLRLELQLQRETRA